MSRRAPTIQDPLPRPCIATTETGRSPTYPMVLAWTYRCTRWDAAWATTTTTGARTCTLQRAWSRTACFITRATGDLETSRPRPVSAIDVGVRAARGLTTTTT